MVRLLTVLALAASVVSGQSLCPDTPVYGRCEIVFELTPQELAAHPNPYLTVVINGEFRSPDHRTSLMPGFWDGGNRFVIRFAPTEPGRWDVRFTGNIARVNNQIGSFNASLSEAPGFIRPRNLHHWSYTERNVPHLWMGDTFYNFATADAAFFRTAIDTRAEQKFTHVRGLVLGPAPEKAFPSPDRPNPDHFRQVDERVAYLNGKGIVADLILGGDRNQLATLFGNFAQRERFMRYMVARYSAFNVTWQLVQEFEEYQRGREFLKELGTALKKLDPYNHPRTTHTTATSAPLLPDGWMDHVLYQSSDDQLGAIEHQLYPVPFVNAEFAYEDSGGGRTHPHHVDSEQFRKRLWNATMNGQYPTFGNTGTYGGSLAQDARFLQSPGARQMTIWYDFFAETRHWELEPYFDLDGGRAVALPGTEYIVYVEKPAGPIEVRVEKHTYDIRWVNPGNGESTKPSEMKSDKLVLEPPSRDHDWVCHISREGRKRGMLRSYKFESRPNLMQEIEADPKRAPFTIGSPADEELRVSVPPAYEAKLARQTRGTRSMMYLWTGEVSIDSQGYRVLGTGSTGTLRIPKDLAAKYPALMNLRLYGMNANGKVYALDKIYRLNP